MHYGDLIVDPQTGDTLDTVTMMNVTTGSVPSTAQGQLIAAYNAGQSATAAPSTTATQAPSILNTILNSITGAANTVLTFDQQQQLNQINVQRAQQGLPALNTQAYLTGQGAGTVSPMSSSTLLLLGLGAVVLVAVVSKRRG